MIHYPDDFLFVEPPGHPGKALSVVVATCAALGVPVAPEKLEGPVLTFLGIELDLQRLSVRLSDDKLAHLRQLLLDWGDRKVCTKRDLLSLIGVLQHAATVIRFGRCFLRRMIDLSTTAHELHHHLRLNREFRSDLQWWALFAPGWNGTGLLFPALQAMPQVIVWSDASGSWGFGACTSQAWFHGCWPESWAQVNITAKELLPIVLVAALWGPQWAGKAIEFQYDNQAVVGCIASWCSREPLVMHLVRGVALLTMQFSFHFRAVHLPRKENVAADALSRDNLSAFFAQMPQAPQAPTGVPPELGHLFLHQHPDWLSATWRQLFNSFLRQASQTPLPGLTR